MMKENKLNSLLNKEEEKELTLSYSRLSDFDRNGPIALVRRSNVDNNGIKHGSLVDILYQDELLNTNEFSKFYQILEFTKPPGMLGTLTDIIAKNYIEMPTDEELIKLCRENKLYSKYKEGSLIELFDVNFRDYVELQFTIKDKKTITMDDYITAKRSVEILLYHNFTKELFFNNLDNYYSVFFEAEIEGFKFKGILDKLTINHKDKTVTMFDIKTGEGKALQFYESFLKYRYYLQEAVYTKAFDEIKKIFNLSDEYTLNPFKFIYVGKSDSSPLIYEIDENWHKGGWNGFTTISGYKYKGLKELIELVSYHYHNNQFEFSQEVYENNGNVKLKSDYIIVSEK